MELLLEARDVRVMFGTVPVVEDVSFKLNKGEILTIIGPNGAGKTTLIKSILGFVPYEGSILFRGAPVSQSLRSVGYVPQRFEFDRTFPITVNEFLRMLQGKIDSGYFSKVCEDLEIDGLLASMLGELSGGQLQRILIARAMLSKPELLVMDEPTAGVDVGGVRGFYDIVRHINQEHKVAVILISHEINMVYSLAQQVLCLNKKMFCVGNPREALTPKVLSLLYGKEVKARAHKHIH